LTESVAIGYGRPEKERQVPLLVADERVVDGEVVSAEPPPPASRCAGLAEDGEGVEVGVATPEFGAREVRAEVFAEVEDVLQAHDDGGGVVAAFAQAAGDHAKKIFVVIGEPKATLFLTQRLRDYLGIDAHAPKEGEVVELMLE